MNVIPKIKIISNDDYFGFIVSNELIKAEIFSVKSCFDGFS